MFDQLAALLMGGGIIMGSTTVGIGCDDIKLTSTSITDSWETILLSPGGLSVRH